MGDAGAYARLAGYTPVARLLHWTTAVLVLPMIPVGIYMANADAGTMQDTLYNLHRSAGMLVLPLIVIRLMYRLAHPPPPLPADIPAFQQLAAHANHWALYVL